MYSSNLATPTPYLHRLNENCSLVKALAWYPFQSNLLESSVGSVDQCIKFWNTHIGACLKTVDTHSQVCSLLWNNHEHDQLSSHGFSQKPIDLMEISIDG